MNDILVVGSMALDSIRTPAGTVDDVLGGSATYFACAAGLFSTVRIVSVVGGDFPDEYLSMLKRKNIDVSGVEIAAGRTFRWCGDYRENLNEARTVSVSQNVLAEFEPHLPDSYKTTPYVFLANIGPDTQAYALSQVSVPELVVCDTMNLWIETKREELLGLLKRVHIIVLNDGEARMLTGRRNLFDAAADILSLGPRAAIIKKGEHGSVFTDGKKVFIVPAFPVPRVFDPTGAGDSFGGGFMGHLAATGDLSGENLKRAVVCGTVLASFTVEGFGVTRLEEVTREDIERRTERLRSIASF